MSVSGSEHMAEDPAIASMKVTSCKPDFKERHTA